MLTTDDSSSQVTTVLRSSGAGACQSASLDGVTGSPDLRTAGKTLQGKLLHASRLLPKTWWSSKWWGARMDLWRDYGDAPDAVAQSQRQSHPCKFALVHGHSDGRRHSGSERVRTARNGNQQSWKACWGQPLTSSNLVSSASASPGTMSKGPAACSGALRRCPSQFPSHFSDPPQPPFLVAFRSVKLEHFGERVSPLAPRLTRPASRQRPPTPVKGGTCPHMAPADYGDTPPLDPAPGLRPRCDASRSDEVHPA